MGMGKGKKITTGYWYYISAHLCLCHGPVDAFTRIRSGDKVIWTGSVTSTSTITINKPDIFGGEDREGGFVGSVDLVMGSSTEAANSYLSSVLPAGGRPAYRNRACIILKQPKVAANNPNIRPINVEVQRQPSPGWRTTKDKPGTAGGVNPAHIIRECLTNGVWGLGYSSTEIDDVSFAAAADTLYTEGFGLSFVWQSSGSILDFITTVIQHIQASLYVAPTTGLFTLKLIRDDYNPATVPVFDESNIIDVDSYERTGVSELVNQVTVIWYETELDKQRSVTVHNPAARELQGATVATTMEFPGIPDATLANKVATRELKKLSNSFSRAVLRTSRAGATLGIGDVIKVSWADLGIAAIYMRVGRIEHGDLEKNEVRLHVVEDIFGANYTVYADPPGSTWSDPISDPAPCTAHRMVEIPYIEIERYFSESPTLMGDLDTAAGMVGYLGNQPTPDSFNYKLYTRIGTNVYVQRSVGIFCPTALISNEMIMETASVLTLTGIEWLSDVELNTYAFIEDECVEVTAITSSTVTVNRGILDTVPVAHAAGTRIWFAEGYISTDTTQWASGASVNAKALTTTGKGTLLEASAPADTQVISRRWYRPYPPGNLKVNGLRWPAAVQTGDLILTWSHRDRTTQLSYYINQTEGNFGPEAGVTYTIRVYRAAGTLARTVTGLTGVTWTYTVAMATADAPGATVTFKIYSDRGGLESWQASTVLINR